MSKRELTITGRVTRIDRFRWQNEDGQGNVKLGAKTIAINLDGRESFMIPEGHEDFPVWNTKVGIGYEVVITTDQRLTNEKPTTSPSGQEVTWLNLNQVHLVAIEPPAIREEFSGLPDVEKVGDDAWVGRTSGQSKASNGEAKGIDRSALEGLGKDDEDVPI